MVAVGIFFAVRKWMWSGAGAAAAILGVHIATYHLALGLGGGALLGYAARWLHREQSQACSSGRGASRPEIRRHPATRREMLKAEESVPRRCACERVIVAKRAGRARQCGFSEPIGWERGLVEFVIQLPADSV